MTRQENQRLAGSLGGEEQRLLVSIRERQRHDRGDVVEQLPLLAARRGDIDKLEGALSEIHEPEDKGA